MHAHKKTVLVILGAVLLMAAVIGWLVSSKPTRGTVKQVVENNKQEVQGSTIEESKDGKKVWVLTVDSMLYDRKTQVDKLKGIKGTFYDKSGKTMTVTADEGEVNVATKNVVLTKNPKGVTSDNATVTAQKITWVNKTQTVVAEGNAVLTKGDTVAKAEKASFNVPMDHATLEKNASVQKGEFK